MARGNPNPKTEHLKQYHYKKGEKRDGKRISESLKKYFKEKKDILFYLYEFEGKSTEELQNLIKEIQEGKKTDISAGCYVALQMWVRMLKGDPNAFKEYADRKFGKAKQMVEHSGELTNNLNINLADNIQKRLNEANK